MCGSVSVGDENSRSMRWNKAVVKRKEDAQKEVLGAGYKDFWKFIKKK